MVLTVRLGGAGDVSAGGRVGRGGNRRRVRGRGSAEGGHQPLHAHAAEAPAVRFLDAHAARAAWTLRAR